MSERAGQYLIQPAGYRSFIPGRSRTESARLMPRAQDEPVNAMQVSRSKPRSLVSVSVNVFPLLMCLNQAAAVEIQCSRTMQRSAAWSSC
jgi:hypothetical protein